MPRPLKQLLWEWRGVWITAPAVTGVVILLRLTGFFQSWEWAAYDQYMRLRPYEEPDQRIAIVGIDEADVNEIGQAIIPDGTYAQLIEKLKTSEPRAIGLDVYRNVPVEPGNRELLQVFQSTPNLVGIQKVVGDSSREAVAPPPVLKEKGQVGANDIIFDSDSKVRRGLLQVESSNGETLPSFGLYLALLYLDAEGIAPKPFTDNPFIWQLGKTMFTRWQANDGSYVRTDDQGYQVMLKYRGGEKPFETVSMQDVLKDRLPKDWGRDRIILIGFVGESFQDFIFTPDSSSLFALPKRMAGVEFHANLTSQVISAALEGRPLIKSWSEPVEGLWILLWSAVGAVLSWQGRYKRGIRQISLGRMIKPILAGGILVGSTFAAFSLGWWIPVIPPFVAISGAAIAITSYLAYNAGKIRETFGRYLTDEVVANLLENPNGAKIGGERRKITILTSDLRGFTATSERLPPEEVVKVLNLYLGHMADIITQYQGTIDEFMGDGILVLFGAPTLRDDDAQRAIACAVAMQLAMVSVNQEMKRLDLPFLKMGIGINTGEVVVGNLGSTTRTKYGVVGSQVNLAYRIESYTTEGQIFISESTLDAVGQTVKIEGEKQVQPKGIKEPITIYEVGGIGEPFNLILPKEEEVFVELAAEISIHYSVLEDKHISNTRFEGSLTKLSTKGAEVRSPHSVAPLSNIKLNLLSSNNQSQFSEDIYAKVSEKPTSNESFYIQFTSLPPTVESILENLYQSSQVDISLG
ncbi:MULTISPECIES: CHASE2 domain-containing protein [unclassified Coleofasciculus]|uniref:CHASE2 domain-containing protein n=1 Tax=unclassified Coleofasciculus TaxID=2692782 RepID=UPI0018816A75|nr:MULTISPECIES: adenylate/guanylate cyclase domain-containing protein [unclassified Coleofasciculus]MBE9127371.1 adenylate/guanylate cyclase domain-containing protein [Coleofasciculus sp. LEGE 07081]MBE9147363.1 adenylate/guanylate cyclase domain-containing protein [Coleofasciculus sp. LEGE 07092]